MKTYLIVYTIAGKLGSVGFEALSPEHALEQFRMTIAAKLAQAEFVSMVTLTAP